MKDDRSKQSFDAEALLRLAELGAVPGRPKNWPIRQFKASAAACLGPGWLVKGGNSYYITSRGRQVLGAWDGQVRAGRVDRMWAPMPVRVWRRLHPRQQDAWVLKWLFGAFELHWDGQDKCTGRNGDGNWHDVPSLIENWKPLDLEDHLLKLGVLA